MTMHISCKHTGALMRRDSKRRWLENCFLSLPSSQHVPGLLVSHVACMQVCWGTIANIDFACQCDRLDAWCDPLTRMHTVKRNMQRCCRRM